MLTDWLIYLDYLEENNCNTYFLRLATPIIFDIINSNVFVNKEKNFDYNVNTNDYSDDYGNGFGDGIHTEGDGDGDGFGDGLEYQSSNSKIVYLDYYDEEH